MKCERCGKPTNGLIISEDGKEMLCIDCNEEDTVQPAFRRLKERIF